MRDSWDWFKSNVRYEFDVLFEDWKGLCGCWTALIIVALLFMVVGVACVSVTNSHAQECTEFQGSCYYPMDFPSPEKEVYLPLVTR